MTVRQRWLLPVALVACLNAHPRADASTPPGQQQFTKCSACHSLEKGVHKMGPSLANLAGRKAGSADGFVYSPAMQQSEVVWTRETLSSFLASPMQIIPGTTMPFGGLSNAEQRAALIEFLLNDAEEGKP